MLSPLLTESTSSYQISAINKDNNFGQFNKIDEDNKSLPKILRNKHIKREQTLLPILLKKNKNPLTLHPQENLVHCPTSQITVKRFPITLNKKKTNERKATIKLTKQTQ